jgi:hypothetical protein
MGMPADIVVGLKYRDVMCFMQFVGNGITRYAATDDGNLQSCRL